MSDFSFSTLRAVYITNSPYRYPIPFLAVDSDNTQGSPLGFAPCVNTGWHILPNFLWGHILNPRQWWEMMIHYEAIKVNSITCRLFNPIPIQTALSFQGTSTFPAFNNTVYALGYSDTIYETPWFDWWSKPYAPSKKQVDQFYEWNPAYKEGLIPQKPDVGPFDNPAEAATGRVQYDDNAKTFPKYYPTKIFESQTSNLMEHKLRYRRQFLPIYWYHHVYKQYRDKYAVNASWLQESSDFEYAYGDLSGSFWDPLNRPNDLLELRPGKNMIEYSWNVHPVDSNIWFNTDRLALLTPYGRPRPLEVDPGSWNMPGRIRPMDPRGPGNFVLKTKYMREAGLITKGQDLTVGVAAMAPESHMGLTDWRRWPVVPPRWFYKEIQQSNPYALSDLTIRYYGQSQTGCPEMSAGSCTAGDVEITGPFPDTKFPGTEYEMHKYPPTQWFIKAVPLVDDAENEIRVEMQMFMHISIHLTGKPRDSAIYAPTWGPIPTRTIYSVNMDAPFGENYMRGRSGGARRTYYNPQDQAPWMTEYPEPFMTDLHPDDSTAVSTATVPVPAKESCIKDYPAGPTPTKPYSSRFCNNSTRPRLRVSVKGMDRRVRQSSDSSSC